MKVYKQNKFGYIEELNTEGSYMPKGWSRTKQAAERKKLKP
jgi:hypothetical protein